MHGMQMSIFADTDLTVDVAPTRRASRATRPSLAAGIAAAQAALDPDAHARAVDAVLTVATPRISQIARHFVASWPVAHVDADDLAQEVLLELVASLQSAPHLSDDHARVWLSSMVMSTLYELRREAMQDADDHRDALAQFAVEQERDAGELSAADGDDDSVDERYYTQAA